jgi:low affinity Fe/Cu permease
MPAFREVLVMRAQFRRFIEKALALLGSAWVILGVVFTAVVWLEVGVILDVPNSWHFTVNLCYSLLVLLICYALRYAQQQQMRAIERKLAEVMKAVEHVPAYEEHYFDGTTKRTTDTCESRVSPYSLN